MLALVALGVAVALTIIQVTNMIKHDVNVKLMLSQEIVPGISRVEIVALRDGQSAPSSTVTMDFDKSHPAKLPIGHRFQLVNGSYELQFRIFSSDESFLRISRQLDVTGQTSVSYRLP